MKLPAGVGLTRSSSTADFLGEAGIFCDSGVDHAHNFCQPYRLLLFIATTTSPLSDLCRNISTHLGYRISGDAKRSLSGLAICLDSSLARTRTPRFCLLEGLVVSCLPYLSLSYTGLPESPRGMDTSSLVLPFWLLVCPTHLLEPSVSWLVHLLSSFRLLYSCRHSIYFKHVLSSLPQESS